MGRPLATGGEEPAEGLAVGTVGLRDGRYRPPGRYEHVIAAREHEGLLAKARTVGGGGWAGHHMNAYDKSYDTL